MTTILLTGGTGTLGRHVTPLLVDAGFKIRMLSRNAHESTDGIEFVTGDLVQGRGIEAAVDGADIILHLAGGPKGDDVATQHLVDAAAKAGVRHIVYIGVIGADKLPIGYFKAKFAAEQAIIESGVPFTILRAAQFHDLALKTARGMAKSPIVPAPGAVLWQPVDAREVAARLVELTRDAPAGRVPDLVGPTVYPMAELVRDYLKAEGKRRLFLPVPVPGKVGRAYRAKENLTLEGATVGELTWEDFLAEQVG
ncbi:NAD(P)H-binding protein [Nocardia sp. NBC_00565]|uniref:SDR family oxidoreductase n=1 Tax=Nocardia sp. NBC_00565 TaxID=2975993 RepID=UPI002E818302|nr:NAD(P)H-binding protein [Nocardia sp. NBC_00565]WUC03876.1 NAD(P)H-binding protein [Nocardia sp. NBC_00565]